MKAALEDLEWRGLLNDITDRDAVEKLTSEESFYVGYDPTAPSLQLGNFLPMMVSMRLAKGGLRALQLFGGATGFIGDPSGRNSERQLLDADVIAAHIQNHQRIVRGIFERAGVPVAFVNNYDWTRDVSVIEFLREVGKHFTVNYMLAKETVKTRLENDGISITEFSYMLLQAFDFLTLYKTHKCRLQIGGSDQWGNITAGLELIRKKIGGEAYALSFPLIVDSQGKKFGKSATGAVWLDERLTSPYKLHQFWLNVDDRDVIHYLKIFTFLPRADIEQLAECVRADPGKREAQRTLADSVCDLIHGPDATQAAKKSAEVLFGGSIEGMSDAQLLDIFTDVPSSAISRAGLASLNVVDLFVQTGLFKSKGEARRQIESGGAYINNNRVTDVSGSCAGLQGSNSAVLILRAGKKNYHLLKLSNQ